MQGSSAPRRSISSLSATKKRAAASAASCEAAAGIPSVLPMCRLSPWMRICVSLERANSAPGREATVPAGRSGHTWNPKMHEVP